MSIGTGGAALTAGRQLYEPVCVGGLLRTNSLMEQLAEAGCHLSTGPREPAHSALPSLATNTQE